jgi:hypothetical protein
MADNTPATSAAPPKETPPKKLYTPRGGASEFESGKYDIEQFSYPSDLYSNRGEYGGNYAIFYINISTDSKLIKQDKAETVDDYPPRDQGDMVAMGLTGAQLTAANTVAPAAEGAIAGGLLTGDVKGAAKGAAVGAGTGLVTGAIVGAQMSRTQKRLKTAIALHIPNNLSINYGVTWSEEDTGALALGAAAAQQGWELTKALATFGKSGDVSGSTIGAIATNIALSKGPNQAGNSVASGLAANPKKEQVFKGVNFRTFSFDYKFFPRNSDEAKNILRIIHQFKYHMHPEFKDGNNFVYIYPSEFDIFYYQNGEENLNLHRHTSCVLTDMSVNYTPNGFTAYEVPGETKPALGRTGMPVAIQLMLQFKETTFLTKDDFKSSGRKDKNSTSKTFSADVSTFSNVDAMGNSNGG